MIVDIFLYASAPNPNDIILCDPTQLCVGVVVGPTPEPGYGAWSGTWPVKYNACGPCPIHPPGVCRRMQNRNGECYCVPINPVAKSLLGDLLERYGAVDGNKIYLAMRDAGLGPFKAGNKYARHRGRPGARKPRRPSSARSAFEGRRRPDER